MLATYTSGQIKIKYIKVHTTTRWTIRHSLMLLWFADLMNVTEEVTIHRPNVPTLLSSAFIREWPHRWPLMKALDRSVEMLGLWIVTSSVTFIKSANQCSIKLCQIKIYWSFNLSIIKNQIAEKLWFVTIKLELKHV